MYRYATEAAHNTLCTVRGRGRVSESDLPSTVISDFFSACVAGIVRIAYLHTLQVLDVPCKLIYHRSLSSGF
jgi:hypothetical protein